MTPTSINALVAAEHTADLHRDSARWRSNANTMPAAAVTPAQAPSVGLRLAEPDETAVVRELADLDDAPPLAGQVLLALIDGQAVAAVSLADGRVVANPFLHTEAAIGLLRLRARHLSVARPRRRLRTILRPRFA